MARFKPGDLPEKYQKQIDEQREYQGKEGEEIKLVIPGEFPTQNEIINKAKTHWAKYKKMKDTYDDIVKLFANKQEIPFYESVKLDITYYRKNKSYDPDNIVAAKKFILDGLRKVGVLKDDGWKQIKGFTESWKVDKENPRIEVIFEEVD